MPKAKTKVNTIFVSHKDNDFEYQVKLPDFKRFESAKTSDVSPYEKFFLWVAKTLGGVPEGKLINVSACWLHPKDDAKLNKLVKTWLSRKFGSPKNILDKEYGYLHLQISPASFQDDTDLPDWLESGYVYIKATELFI